MDRKPQLQSYTQWILSLYQIFGPPEKYRAAKQFETDYVQHAVPS
jgi:hypothetical protein